MKKKSKISLALLKYNSVVLYKKGQLPFALCDLVQKITKDTSYLEVHLLTGLSERYLRVRNYYKKYKEEEKIANKEIYYAVNKIRKGDRN